MRRRGEEPSEEGEPLSRVCARPAHVTAEGGPVALATVSGLRAATSSISSRDPPGREAPAMDSSGAVSVSVGASVSGTEGTLEADKISGKSENTYILRPVFQQRRVQDGLRRGDLRDCWAGQAELAWKPGCRAGSRGEGGGGAAGWGWGGAGLTRAGRGWGGAGRS